MFNLKHCSSASGYLYAHIALLDLNASKDRSKVERYVVCTGPIQGDYSGCDKPPVDIKTKILFQYEELILKHNTCFGVNGRFESKWPEWVTL